MKAEILVQKKTKPVSKQSDTENGQDANTEIRENRRFLNTEKIQTKPKRCRSQVRRRAFLDFRNLPPLVAGHTIPNGHPMSHTHHLRPHLLTLLAALLIGTASAAMACQTPANADRLRTQLETEINRVRGQNNLPPMRRSETLQSAAQSFSCHNARRNVMSHTGADGSTLADRTRAAGYRHRFLAENLAVGYQDPQRLVNAWMNSPAHRDNLLNRNPTEMGVGIASHGQTRWHWTLKLGR